MSRRREAAREIEIRHAIAAKVTTFPRGTLSSNREGGKEYGFGGATSRTIYLESMSMYLTFFIE